MTSPPARQQERPSTTSERDEGTRHVKSSYHNFRVQPRILPEFRNLRLVHLRVSAAHHQRPEPDGKREHGGDRERAHRQRFTSRPSNDVSPRRAPFPYP